MRVVVVMSTFDGERFVGEQVASILSQLPADGRLLVRDDGSRDRTADIIAAIGDPRVALTRGENLGFARSFFSLLDAVPGDAEMVMLSDQDDVWLPGRIERAWQVLGPSGGEPVLYCSRMRLVDSQLRPLGLSRVPRRGPSFDNALAENIVTGCTAALNPAALRIVRAHAGSARVHFHDWWLYLVVAAFGRVVFDPEPTVLYRQHGNNVIGMGAGLARYRSMLRFLRSTNWVHVMFMQVEHFRAVHAAALDADKRLLLDRYFDPHEWRSVARLLFAPRRFQQSWVGEALFRGLLLACIASGQGLLPPRHEGQRASSARPLPGTEVQHDPRFTLISLVPELHAGTGHVLGYHTSVGEAARIAGWRHVALVPHDHGVQALPEGWLPVLRPGTLTAGLLAAIRGWRLRRLVRDTALFADSVREGVAAVFDRGSHGALFVERFNGAQLLGVVRASRLLCSERLDFWLMFRQDLQSTGIVGRLAYRWAVKQLARDWGERFRLLADSESLAGELERELGVKAHVMPIPHTHESVSAPFAKEAREIVCWWPGAPRDEKGLASIQRLAAAAAVEGIGSLRLVLSEETPLAEGLGIRVERVPARLGEVEYDRWLATADVILLPYVADRYRHSTSGIFVEAVVGGSLPLVSAGTWMADELRRHDLAELVVDWGDAVHVLRRIDALARDARVRAKLGIMREHYAGYHCERAYATALRALVRA